MKSKYSIDLIVILNFFFVIQPSVERRIVGVQSKDTIIICDSIYSAFRFICKVLRVAFTIYQSRKKKTKNKNDDKHSHTACNTYTENNCEMKRTKHQAINIIEFLFRQNAFECRTNGGDFEHGWVLATQDDWFTQADKSTVKNRRYKRNLSTN